MQPLQCLRCERRTFDCRPYYEASLSFANNAQRAPCPFRPKALCTTITQLQRCFGTAPKRAASIYKAITVPHRVLCLGRGIFGLFDCEFGNVLKDTGLCQSRLSTPTPSPFPFEGKGR